MLNIAICFDIFSNSYRLNLTTHETENGMIFGCELEKHWTYIFPYPGGVMTKDQVIELRKFLNEILKGDIEMPIPGDNGNPSLEKKQQEERINHVANTGACVQKEVKLNPPEAPEKCIFGEI